MEKGMDIILTLGILITGFLLMIGGIRPGRAFNLIGVIIFSAISLPFFGQSIKGVDSWFILIFGVIFSLILFQWLMGLIFGTRAADSAVGSLVSNILLAPFRPIIGFFKTLFFRGNI